MVSILRAIRDWAIVVSSVVLLTLVFLVGYLMLLDGTVINPVITYETMVFPVDKSIYAPGDMVVARNRFYKSRDLMGTMRWNLVNHKIQEYATKDISLPMGVHDIWFPIEKLPNTSCGNGGEYHFEGLVEYQVNPLRTITYKISTEPFRIMPPAPTKE